MLPLHTTTDEEDLNGAFRILITGFGPFSHYNVNPSWLAVQPLHNAILTPTIVEEDKIRIQAPSRRIHITALEIPISYDAVLAVVPKLHTRPPVLPELEKSSFSPPPQNGYDFVFHVGVAGRGPLRMERQGHKIGYQMKDVNGKLAPIVRSSPKDFSRRPEGPSVAENLERERLGFDILESPGDTSGRSSRGFGPLYETFSEEIMTEIDVTRLVQDIRQTGVEQIYTSMDAGHYLCDFIYYCSLAEAKRSAKPYEKRRNTQVLFMHCPPVNQPVSTEEVTQVIKQIIMWVCREIEIQDENDAEVDGVAGI